MKPLAEALLERVKETGLFREGETVLVCVSGGADSVALLDLLRRLPLKLAVAHLNHRLRGAASDGDEAFVAELASSRGIPCYRRSVDVARLASLERLTLEEAGRAARYRFFRETAAAIGATSIALAHHRDDQAETVLMRLLRGSGGSGLSAMAPSAGILKRPLLAVSRAELEEYLRERGLTWRTDESNCDTTLLRNSIRHELIPFLERYNPAVAERLADTARTLAADEELLQEVTVRAFAECAERRAAAVSLDIEKLVRHPLALRMRLYRMALDEVRGLQRIARSHLEALDRLVHGERPQGTLSLPGGTRVTRRYAILTVSAAPQPPDCGYELSVAGEGRHLLPQGGILEVQRVPMPACIDAGSPSVAYFCAAAVPFPWLVRTFRPGDRFRPLGMQGEQKVKDFFINNKVNHEERRRVPLIFSAGRLVWIGGYRMAEDAALRGENRGVLRAEILNFTP